jgi:hypothetical protein
MEKTGWRPDARTDLRRYILVMMEERTNRTYEYQKYTVHDKK